MKSVALVGTFLVVDTLEVWDLRVYQLREGSVADSGRSEGHRFDSDVGG